MPYIKLDTRIREWEWHDSPNIMALWIAILYSANWKENEWHGITVHRGEFITSVRHLSIMTGLSDKQIRCALNHLKETNEVAIRTTNRYTVITVNKWDEYQFQEPQQGKQNGEQMDKQRASQGQTEGKQRATTEAFKHLSIKAVNKRKDIPALFSEYTDDPAMLELLNEWYENRKAKRAANTENAIRKNLDKLQELAKQSNMDDRQYLSEIVRLGWTAFYPIRQQGQLKTFKQMDEEREEQKYVHKIGEVLDDKPW